MNLLAVFDINEPERSTRLRELRVAARLMLGPRHPVSVALANAIISSDVLGAAIEAIDALPALPRRRLLATLAAVLH